MKNKTILVRVESLSDELYEALRQFGEVELISKRINIYAVTMPTPDPEAIAKVAGVITARFPDIGTFNIEFDEPGYMFSRDEARIIEYIKDYN